MTAEGVISPIFVVGMDRSGSKWLCNELSRHPDVISVQSERHTGMLESSSLVNMAANFDLRQPDEYIGFIEMWFGSDFVRITGVEKDFFYRIRPRPTTYAGIFRSLMDEYARRHGKRYWLQKASPQVALRIMPMFEGARWVVIQRDIVGNLQSKMRLSERTGFNRSLTRSIAGYVLEEKILDWVRVRTNAVSVTYEQMLEDAEVVVAKALGHLELPARGLEAGRHFRRNTSFAAGESKESYFSRRQRRLIRGVAVVVRAVPFPVLRAVRNALPVQRRLDAGTYYDIRDEYGID